jgi:hypothetical protein
MSEESVIYPGDARATCYCFEKLGWEMVMT